MAIVQGSVAIINSTLVENTAGDSGGGLHDGGGEMTVTNCTFSENAAPSGGGLYSEGTLLLRNTILANGEGGEDCVAAGVLDPGSTHNIIDSGTGCGASIVTASPRLGELGSYNGPTPTVPLGGGSPAINLGDNHSAVDENGQPLRWDQRGNGDPRFVGGITDIGAFETQRFPVLKVDTLEDTELRACTKSTRGDCSLRGAITLANATEKADVIEFEPEVFSEPAIIILNTPLPYLENDLSIDARGTAGVVVRGPDRHPVFNRVNDTQLDLIGITTEVQVPPEPARSSRDAEE